MQDGRERDPTLGAKYAPNMGHPHCGALSDMLGVGRERQIKCVRVSFPLRLHFVDRAAERSQEFAVFAGAGSELKEIVRQQWTFSPYGSTEEIEDYTVNLSGITTLELRIDPDRSHDPK